MTRITRTLLQGAGIQDCSLSKCYHSHPNGTIGKCGIQKKLPGKVTKSRPQDKKKKTKPIMNHKCADLAQRTQHGTQAPQKLKSFQFYNTEKTTKLLKTFLLLSLHFSEILQRISQERQTYYDRFFKKSVEWNSTPANQENLMILKSTLQKTACVAHFDPLGKNY